jgi:hypothetical protein
MPLIQTVYCSQCKPTMLLSDVHKLLIHAKAKNSTHEITGMLVFNNQFFLQLIEGDAHTVDNLMALIAADTRHESVHIIERAEIANRRWANWSMGMATRDESSEAIFKRYDMNGRFDPYQLPAGRAGDMLVDLTTHAIAHMPQ